MTPVFSSARHSSSCRSQGAPFAGLAGMAACSRPVSPNRRSWRVLQRPRIAPKIAPFVVDYIRAIFAAAELVTIAARVAACRDPKDDKFLELALNGRADAIVSGDTDLLALDTFRGIPIVTPAAFLHTHAIG